MSVFETRNSSAYTSTDRNNMPLSKWNFGSYSADEALLPTLDELRDQCGDLERKDSLANSILSTIVDNVVGTGLTIKPKIDHEFLGISVEEKEKWEKQVAKYFNKYAQTTEFDISKRNNFYSATRLALRTSLSRGDAFSIRRYTERTTNPINLAFQLIEGDRIENPNNLYDIDSKTKAGIKFDREGVPLTYFVKNLPDRYNQIKYSTVPAFDGLGNPVVIPLVPTKRADQSRGEPLFAPTIHLFKQLSSYLQSEVDAAVIASKFTVFITKVASENRAVPPDRLNKKAESKSGPREISKEEQQQKNIISMGNGAIIELIAGEKIELANPTRPNTTADVFVMLLARFMAASCGLPLSLVLKVFTASYSASQGEILQAEKYFKILRAWLVTYYCQPHYEAVLASMISNGLVKAPGFFDDFFIRQSWLGTRWRCPSGGGMLDPLKCAKAADIFVNTLKIRDRETFASEFFGEDINHTFETLFAENRRISEEIQSIPDPEEKELEDDSEDDSDD